MSHPFTTDADVRRDVDQALQGSPGYPGDYDVDGIVREIIERVGVEGYADLPHDEFWQIVAHFDRTQVEPDDLPTAPEERRPCPYGCPGGHTQYEYDDTHRNPEGGYEPPWF